MRKLRWLSVTAVCLVIAMVSSFAVLAEEDKNIFHDDLTDLTKIYQSEGAFLVKHDVGTPDDMDRIYKSGLEKQSIIYKMESPITGYEIKAYNTKGNIDAMLDVYLSKDGENWEKSSFTYETEVGVAEGWNWATLVQKKKTTKEYFYLKMTMGDNVNTWNPQISDVMIFMNGLTARPFQQEAEGEEAKQSYADYNNQQAAAVVYGNHVLEPGKSGKDTVLTRGEFARAVLEMTGLDTENLVMGSDSGIKDVTKSTEYAAEIYTVVSKKIMGCYADGSFEPKSEITYLQAVKAVVNALGYRNTLEAGAGDHAYLSKAAQLGINKNLSGITENTGLSREQGVQLLFNGLNTPPVLVKNYGSGGELSQEKESILKGQKDVQERKGQITAVYDGSLSGGGVELENMVEIDGVLYETKDASIGDFLGRGITYYTDKDDVVIAYSLHQRGGAPLTIFKEDLDTTKTNFENGTIAYYENGDKKKTVKIKLDYMALNGSKADISYDLLTLPDMYLTLYDSDEDNIYDTAMVEQYTYMIVKSVNTETEILQGLYGESLALEDYDKVQFYKGGQPVGVETIKTDQTISILKSADGRYLKGYIRTVKMKGKITGKKEEKVLIDQEEYIISQRYQELSQTKKNPNDSKTIVPELKAGLAGTFYLGKNYEVIGFVPQMISAQYAYLIQAGCDESQTDMFFKLYTESGEFVTETVQEMRVIDENGSTKKVHGEELNKVLAPDQLVILELNDDGTIQSISKKLSLDVETKTGSFNGTSIISGTYPVLAASKFFYIPEDRRDYDSYKYQMCLIEGDARETSSDTKYHMKLYDIDDMNSPRAIVVYRDEAIESNQVIITKQGVVVNEISRELNLETGEVETKLVVGPDEAKVSLCVSDKVNVENMTGGNKDFRNLKRGDFIIYGLNGNGKVIRITVMLNTQDGIFFSDNGMIGGFGENLKQNPDYPFFYGSVKNFGSGFLLLDQTTHLRTISAPAPRVYLYDKKADEIKKVTINEIQYGDKLVVKAVRFVASDVLIVRD